MKAVVYTQYGSPEVLQLQKLDRPKPKENEVLIKVKATTVNRTDLAFLKADPFLNRFFTGLFSPKIKVLGSEFAGDVVAIGSMVKEFKIGDRVFGLSCQNMGVHAEYLCLPEAGSMTQMPANWSYEEAAAICEGHWLALTYLQAIDIQKGQRILINGATGSIGSSGLQLCNYYGAEITAVCATKDLDLIKSLGAQKVIDYTKEDFTQSGGSYDFVFDAVGKSSFGQCKKLLKPAGIYFSTELGAYFQNPFLALWTSWFASKKVIFPIPKDHKKDILFFKNLAEAGDLKALIDRTYSLEKIAEAYSYVKMGQKVGSVVVTIS